MNSFMDENFLLQTKTARILFHEYAATLPVFDYHCHIPVREIAEDRRFDNLVQIWLEGDHYKWRAMRSNGINEHYITGKATDFEKFKKWAETVPFLIRNPLFHWTHLELRNIFNVDRLLKPATATEIWNNCNAQLRTNDFSSRGIIRKANVHTICTTDDPIDSLEYHKIIKVSDFKVKVYPAWRPDNAMAIEKTESFNTYIDQLGSVTGITIDNFISFLDAIEKRHIFFHENGCRLSDHGLNTMYAELYTLEEIKKIFKKVRSGRIPSMEDTLKFKSAMLYEFAVLDHKRGWTQQFHIGAIRDNNNKMYEVLGQNIGFDSIGDEPIAISLSKFLDRLEFEQKLTRTIIYNLNPRDNYLMGSMIGNFQDGSEPGKIQWGSAWWFLDQKDGIIEQLNALSNLSLLSRFIGMLTDSRSLLSYSRHEYFRRILCNLLGNDVENGEIPADMELLGQVVEDICFNNAEKYFRLGDSYHQGKNFEDLKLRFPDDRLTNRPVEQFSDSLKIEKFDY